MPAGSGGFARRCSACVAAAVVLFAAVASASSATPPRGLGVSAEPGACVPGADWGTLHEELVPKLLDLINAHRAAIGVGPLAVSGALTASAAWKALHMAAYDYLGPDDPAPPVTRPFYERFAACGYSGLIAGENGAEGLTDPADVASKWLDDPDSRATIEHQGYAITGLAAAISASGKIYWVQEYGAAPAPPQQPARCHVPSLFGKTLAAAKGALRRAHCTLGRVRSVRSRHTRRGLVVAQTPRPEATLEADGAVTLVLSSGRR
jgi:uncharacterized protein YkwD